jgi:putative Ca2+/H+ antiporter (TMEM165/GDT1 family)
MMTAYLASLGFVVLAEMGDKTKISSIFTENIVNSMLAGKR